MLRGDLNSMLGTKSVLGLAARNKFCSWISLRGVLSIAGALGAALNVSHLGTCFVPRGLSWHT